MVRNLLYPARLASTFVRAILRDPVIYPDPGSFKPERFINSDGGLRDDPVLVTAVFGSGKRICPGRHLADSMIFIVVASLLSVFNIKSDNPNGRPDNYPFTGTAVKYGCRVLLMT
jgi:cytochrome P450